MADHQSFKFLVDRITNLKRWASSVLETFNSSKSDLRCCKCKEHATLSCSSCGDFYCSEECQENDWIEHRLSCVQKPPLIKINTQNERIPEKNSLFFQQQISKLAIHCESFAKQLENIKHGTNETFGSNAGVQKYLPVQRPIRDVTHNNHVIIVCFGTLNKVYVCPENNYVSYCDVLKQVDEYGQRAPPLQRIPEKNSLVISKRAGRYCRAKIVNHSFCGNLHKIRVSYIDFGNFSTRHIWELRAVNLEIADLPVYVVDITLKKVINVMLGTSVWQSVLNTFERKTYLMKSQKNGEVELFEADTGECLNEKIMTIVATRLNEISAGEFSQNEQDNVQRLNYKGSKVHFACSIPELIEENNNEIEEVALMPVMNAPFLTNVISRSELNVKAIVIDNSMIQHGYVACILKKNIKEFNELQTYLKEKRFENGKPYVPQQGEYVIAEYLGEWYRGHVICVQPDGNKFEVFYDDFLNIETVDKHKVRHYPVDLTIACNTQLCALSGLPKRVTPEIKMFLKNEIKIMDKIIIDRVVDLDEGVALIECKQILDRMLEQNLI